MDVIAIRKRFYGLVCVLVALTLIISIANSGVLKPNYNDFEYGKVKLGVMEKNHGRTNNDPAERFFQTSTDYEVVFTAPFDYVDNGSDISADPTEKDKWSARAYVDDTGLCLLNVSVLNVSTWGHTVAYAAIGGNTTAVQTYERPKAEFYFSAGFNIFDDIELASKSQMRVLYFYYEDDEVLGAGVLSEWVQSSGSREYIIDYTENPLSVELGTYEGGRTYALVLYFEAYIEATGGSGTCYVDAYNVSIERDIQVEQIRLYDECEWGSDLEVLEYSLEWDKVEPGDEQTGYIELYNAGTLCSKLDWEVFAWPEWGTWAFDPAAGNDLTDQEGPIRIDVRVQAPDQSDKNFSGEIKIRNINDQTDIETLTVKLATPIKHTLRNFIQSARAIFESIHCNFFTVLFQKEQPQLVRLMRTTC